MKPANFSQRLKIYFPEFTTDSVTRKQIIEAVALYNNGYNYTEIARKMNKNVSGVINLLSNRYNLFFKKPSNTLDKEQFQLLLRLYKEGKGDVIIANALKTDHTKISRWRAWLNVIYSTDLQKLMLTRPLISDIFIYQKDNKNNFIKKYKSQNEIIRHFPNFCQADLKCAIDNNAIYQNYLWEKKGTIKNVCDVQELLSH